MGGIPIRYGFEPRAYSFIFFMKGNDIMNKNQYPIHFSEEKYSTREATLADTAALMSSSDYKERFVAEYDQTAIRYNKLAAMIEKWDNGTLEFEPTCPRSTYDMQLSAMKTYLSVLEARAVMEGVTL